MITEKESLSGGSFFCGIFEEQFIEMSSKKISPDTIEKLNNGNVTFSLRGEQQKVMPGDALALIGTNPHRLIIKNSNDEFEVSVGSLTKMILRGVQTTLTAPTSNKGIQYKDSVDTIFKDLAKNYFAGGGDVVSISDIGENRAVKEVSSWTADTGGYYYYDFSHGLNTSDIFYTIVDLSTNEVVVPHAFKVTDSNTVRITVFGNTANLRISLTSGGFGHSTSTISFRSVRADTTAILGEHLEVDTDDGDVTVTLPNPDKITDTTIWNIGGNDVIIDTDSYTVNDSSSDITMSTKYDCLTLSSNGTRYLKKSDMP